MKKNIVNKKWRLNSEEWTKWFKNAVIFFAPAGIIFITTVQTGGSIEDALIAFKVWGLSTALDLLRKLQEGK